MWIRLLRLCGLMSWNAPLVFFRLDSFLPNFLQISVITVPERNWRCNNNTTPTTTTTTRHARSDFSPLSNRLSLRSTLLFSDLYVWWRDRRPIYLCWYCCFCWHGTDGPQRLRQPAHRHSTTFNEGNGGLTTPDAVVVVVISSCDEPTL